MSLADPGIIVRQRPELNDLVDWMSTVNGFIESSMSDDDGFIDLEPYQQLLNSDTRRSVITIKSRQVGWSFNAAACGLAKALLRPGYTGIFVSYGLKEAKEKIRYAKQLRESLPNAYRLELIEDQQLSIEFTNGSRLFSVFDPRGWSRADVWLDELARMPRAREVYRSANYVRLHGGSLYIGSSFLGKGGLFWEIASQYQNKYKRFSRHEIPWWASRFLCRDVAKAKGVAARMVTEERVDRFGSEALQDIFEGSLLEDFQEECELTPQDEAYAYITMERILACAVPEIDTDISYEKVARIAQYPLVSGFDVGRRRNASVLSVLEKENGRYHEKLKRVWRKLDFEGQRHQLKQFITICKPIRLCIDETGIGMQLAEELSREFPSVVEPVNFAARIESKIKKTEKRHTIPIKERMVTNVKILFEKGDIRIASDREMVDQIHAIRRIITPSGGIRYDSEKSDRTELDQFWALALAVHAGDYKEIDIGLASSIGDVSSFQRGLESL